MSRRRAAAILVLRGIFVAVWLTTLLALHFPAPSGVASEARQEDVRGVWRLFAWLGGIAGRFVPSFAEALFDTLFDDKTIHFGLFFGLAAPWAAIRRLKKTLDPKGAALIVVVLATYAAAGELAQALGGRVPELGDWIANVAGVVLGVLVVLPWRRVLPALRAWR